MAEQVEIKNQIKQRLKELRDGGFNVPKEDMALPLSKNFGEKRDLRGHFQKVYSVHWAGHGSDLFISASQDGKLIIWNADTKYKINAITLKDNFVMSCAFEQSRNQLLATGGLSTCAYIYKQREYEQGQSHQPEAELTGHDGYVSCCRFINDSSLVTSSGDNTCKLWDLSEEKATHVFRGHTHDVMSISPHPTNEYVFVSGSIDLECKLWDTREKGDVAQFVSNPTRNAFSWDDETEFEGEVVGAKMIYNEHESDINSVAYFPDGFAFGSGSDDQTCRLWDTRSHQEINLFRNSSVVTGANSIDFSKSGRILFAGYESAELLLWDTLKNPTPDTNESLPIQTLNKHRLKITSVSVHTGGKAVATASWDTFIKIYA